VWKKRDWIPWLALRLLFFNEKTNPKAIETLLPEFIEDRYDRIKMDMWKNDWPKA
jgi:hypothetical protein